MFAVYLLALVVAAFLFHQLYWRRRGLPPGPLPMPLLGNVLAINPTDTESGAMRMYRMFKRYPRLCTLWMGPTMPVVLVNDYELIKEHIIKQGDSYAGRPHSRIQEQFRNGRYGIITTDGDQWKEQRRFSLHVLRDFGFGRNIMEIRIMDEVHHFIENIQTESGGNDGVVDIYKQIQTCVGNIINAVVFGKRFPTGEEVHYIKNKLDESQKASSNPLFLLLVNDWSRKVPIVNRIWKEFDDLSATMFTFFQQQLDELRKTFDPTAEADSFVGAYLKEMYDREQKQMDASYFCDAQLKGTILDVWLAGLQTTVDTLCWSFLYMINYPEVQDKIHEEIDSVIGKEAEIVYSDRSKLPYTMAVVHEVQRCVNLVPFNIMRCSPVPVVIDGYTIPAGTSIVPQIGAVMWDERYFPEPLKFKPERFLNETDDGATLKVPEQLTPFSVGKRACLGESLARMELFMIFANTLQRYHFNKVRGEPFPTMKPRKQFNVQPEDYKCTVTLRV